MERKTNRERFSTPFRPHIQPPTQTPDMCFLLTLPWIFEPVVYSNHRSKSPVFIEKVLKLGLIVQFFTFWEMDFTLISLPAYFPWLINQARIARPVRLAFFHLQLVCDKKPVFSSNMCTFDMLQLVTNATVSSYFPQKKEHHTGL